MAPRDKKAAARPVSSRPGQGRVAVVLAVIAISGACSAHRPEPVDGPRLFPMVEPDPGVASSSTPGKSSFAQRLDVQVDVGSAELRTPGRDLEVRVTVTNVSARSLEACLGRGASLGIEAPVGSRVIPVKLYGRSDHDPCEQEVSLSAGESFVYEETTDVMERPPGPGVFHASVDVACGEARRGLCPLEAMRASVPVIVVSGRD